MVPELKIALLGRPKISFGGEPVTDFVSDKALVLLCYVALRRPSGGHARSALAALLWGDMPEDRAKANLRMALYNLQKLVPDVWETSRKSIGLRVGAAVWLDIETLRDESAADDPAALQAVIDLYRGDFLEGIDVADAPELEEWLRQEREASRLRALALVEKLVELTIRAGRWEEGIEANRRLLRLEPWREENHRLLMRLLARTGQLNAALKQYQLCRDELARELGVEPEAETTALYEHLRSVRQRGRLSNLPRQADPLIGRELELGTLFTLFNDSEKRLITLTGPGGSGKTRLALAAAEAHAALFLDGAVFVPLADVASRAGLVATVAQVLGVSPDPRTPLETALIDFFRPRELLLVLDNVEQMVDAAAEVSLAILEQAPRVKLMVTTREVLRLRWETRLRLTGLVTPPAEAITADELVPYAAVSLFVHQARKIDPAFVLTGHERPVRDICRLVEGVPLALELAGALVEDIQPQRLFSELSLSFDRLKATLRDFPDRHRSLQAVFDYSWRLLPDAEKEMLARLSVFHGSFDAVAAAEVAGVPEGVLESLRRKSLVQRRDDSRFGLHSAVREYAEKQLAPDQMAAVMSAHQSYYLGLVGAAAEALYAPEQAEIAQGLRVDLDNILAGWRTAVSRDEWGPLEEAAPALRRLFDLAGLVDVGEMLFSETLARLPEDTTPADHAGLLVPAVHFLVARHEFERVRELLEEAERAGVGRPADRAALAYYAGIVHSRLGDLDRSLADLERAIEVARTHELPLIEGQCWVQVGLNNEMKGRYEEAAQGQTQAIDLFKQAGDLLGQINAQRLLGIMHFRRNRQEEARDLIAEALADQERLDPTGRGSGMLLANLGTVTYNLGESEKSRRLFLDAKAIFERMGDRLGEALAADMLGRIAAYDGQFSQAEEYYQRALALRRAVGVPKGTADVERHLADLAIEMGDYARAVALLRKVKGVYEEIDDPRSRATTAVSLVQAYLELGELPAAEGELELAEKIAAGIDNPLLKGYIIRAQALLAGRRGDRAAAAAAFEAAAAFWESLQMGDTHLALRAGWARAVAEMGETERGAEILEPVVAGLAERPRPDIDGVAAVYRDCVVVLKMAGDLRAEALRRQGRGVIEEQLARIQDPAARRRFIEAVPGNQFLLGEP